LLRHPLLLQRLVLLLVLDVGALARHAAPPLTGRLLGERATAAIGYVSAPTAVRACRRRRLRVNSCGNDRCDAAGSPPSLVIWRASRPGRPTSSSASGPTYARSRSTQGLTAFGAPRRSWPSRAGPWGSRARSSCRTTRSSSTSSSAGRPTR